MGLSQSRRRLKMFLGCGNSQAELTEQEMSLVAAPALGLAGP